MSHDKHHAHETSVGTKHPLRDVDGTAYVQVYSRGIEETRAEFDASCGGRPVEQALLEFGVGALQDTWPSWIAQQRASHDPQTPYGCSLVMAHVSQPNSGLEGAVSLLMLCPKNPATTAQYRSHVVAVLRSLRQDGALVGCVVQDYLVRRDDPKDKFVLVLDVDAEGHKSGAWVPILPDGRLAPPLRVGERPGCAFWIDAVWQDSWQVGHA